MCAVLVYKCLHGSAPSYLVDKLCQMADVKARQRLRSTSSSSLIVNRTRLSTVGDRAFPVAVTHVWNGLPQHVTSSPSIAVFQSILRLICSPSRIPPLSSYSAHCPCREVFVALDTGYDYFMTSSFTLLTDLLLNLCSKIFHTVDSLLPNHFSACSLMMHTYHHTGCPTTWVRVH